MRTATFFTKVYGKSCTKTTAWSLHSVDGPNKVYVQHKLKSMEQEVWEDYLKPEDGLVFICGDGWDMAPQVHQRLVDITAKYEAFIDKQSCTDYLKHKTGLDVWES